MYQRIKEQETSMSAIATKTNARQVTVVTNESLVRGYHFDPRRMDESDKDFVFRSVFPVGLEAFTQNPSKSMEDDIADHIFNTSNLVVLRSDGTIRFLEGEYGEPRPIAFCVWNTYDTSVGHALYISGVCVNPAWQGHGFGRALQQYALLYEDAQKDVEWAFMSTQNAVEKLSFDRAMGNKSYPQLGHDGPISGTVRHAGKVFAEARGVSDHYNADTMTLKRHYGGASLYGRMPECKNERYEQLFNCIDRKNGDAYLCVTRIK